MNNNVLWRIRCDSPHEYNSLKANHNRALLEPKVKHAVIHHMNITV